MSLWDVLLLTLALGLHFFESSMTIGAGQCGLSFKRMAWLGLALGAAQCLLLALGLLLARLLFFWQPGWRPSLAPAARAVWVAVGLWLIFRSAHAWRRAAEERRQPRLTTRGYLGFLCLRGLNTELLGFSVGVLSEYFWRPLGLLWLLSALCGGLGLAVGYWRGPCHSRILCFGSGAVLCLAACHLLSCL